jgi:hypothetical protein
LKPEITRCDEFFWEEIIVVTINMAFSYNQIWVWSVEEENKVLEV